MPMPMPMPMPPAATGTGTPYVYVANQVSSAVTAYDVATGTSTAIPVGTQPGDVAVSPDGTTVYATNGRSNTVSVISTATNTVTIPVGGTPGSVAVSPDGRTVYVTNYGGNDISVISAATGTVTSTVPAGTGPSGVAATVVPPPCGHKCKPQGSSAIRG